MTSTTGPSRGVAVLTGALAALALVALVGAVALYAARENLVRECERFERSVVDRRGDVLRDFLLRAAEAREVDGDRDVAAEYRRLADRLPPAEPVPCRERIPLLPVGGDDRGLETTPAGAGRELVLRAP